MPKRIPAMLLNILFTQVEDMMGHRSLTMLLRQAGLDEYVDAMPPMDDTPTITVDQYSELLASIYEIFGARGAKPIFLRGGRLGAAEIRRQRPAQFAIGGAALRLLPTVKRMRIVLEKLVAQGEEMYGATYHLAEEENAFLLSIESCHYCAAITHHAQAAGRQISRPVCHIPTAIIAEMIEWATGQKHLVEETACIATGDPACRFRISKS